jgi:hypothetical protein
MNPPKDTENTDTQVKHDLVCQFQVLISQVISSQKCHIHTGLCVKGDRFIINGMLSWFTV